MFARQRGLERLAPEREQPRDERRRVVKPGAAVRRRLHLREDDAPASALQAPESLEERRDLGLGEVHEQPFDDEEGWFLYFKRILQYGFEARGGKIGGHKRQILRKGESG